MPHMIMRMYFWWIYLCTLYFTCMPGESYCRWLQSLLLCLCDLFWVLIHSFVCQFCTSAVGLVLFKVTTFIQPDKHEMWNWPDNEVLQLDGQQTISLWVKFEACSVPCLPQIWKFKVWVNLQCSPLEGFGSTGTVKSAFYLQYPTSLFDRVLVFTGSYSQKLFTYYLRTAQVMNLEVYESRIASHFFFK